jgi:hypothetical protein
MEFLGVHPVQGVECFLVEAVITGASVQPDFGQVTQPSAAEQADWQVAYGEALVSPDGTSIVADLFAMKVENWPFEARVTFWFHHLDVDRPLTTPFGEATVPAPTERPDRLAMLEYDAP